MRVTLKRQRAPSPGPSTPDTPLVDITINVPSLKRRRVHPPTLDGRQRGWEPSHHHPQAYPTLNDQGFENEEPDTHTLVQPSPAAERQWQSQPEESHHHHYQHQHQQYPHQEFKPAQQQQQQQQQQRSNAEYEKANNVLKDVHSLRYDLWARFIPAPRPPAPRYPGFLPTDPYIGYPSFDQDSFFPPRHPVENLLPQPERSQPKSEEEQIWEESMRVYKHYGQTNRVLRDAFLSRNSESSKNDSVHLPRPRSPYQPPVPPHSRCIESDPWP